MKKVLVALAVVAGIAVGFGWSQSVSQAQETGLSTRCEIVPARLQAKQAVFDELRAEGRTTFIVVKDGSYVCAW